MFVYICTSLWICHLICIGRRSTYNKIVTRSCHILKVNFYTNNLASFYCYDPGIMCPFYFNTNFALCLPRLKIVVVVCAVFPPFCPSVQLSGYHLTEKLLIMAWIQFAFPLLACREGIHHSLIGFWWFIWTWTYCWTNSPYAIDFWNSMWYHCNILQMPCFIDLILIW